MVSLGAILGAATGGFPGSYATPVATVALVLAMTFSLADVRFAGLSVRAEARAFGRAFVWNYVVLSGLIVALGFLYADPSLRNGWIVMAAGPSAIAVIPLTTTLHGNARNALVSTALLYVAALGLYPGLTLAFAGQAMDVGQLAVQIVIQIVLPLAASRPLAQHAALGRHRQGIVNVSFFVLVFAIIGINRSVFFQSPELVAGLAAGAFVRTWVIGLVAYVVSGRMGATREQRVSDTLFATLKNLALAALVALALFGPLAAMPAIVCLFFEIAWLVPMQRLFQR